MRQMADSAQSEELRSSFLRLEASWLRLAETADKADADDQTNMPPPENDNGSTSPRPN